jgi:hypothetical protein
MPVDTVGVLRTLVNRLERVSMYPQSVLHESTEINSTNSSRRGMKTAPGSSEGASTPESDVS